MRRVIARDGACGRWRCVKKYVIKPERNFFVTQKARESIERGDFYCTGAGELLLHARHFLLWQHASIGTDHALTVFRGRRLRIDVESKNSWHGVDRGGHRRQGRSEHRVKV